VRRLDVLVVGGGFGGLQVARSLRNANARIILIDRRNHHLFQPLLYQVATAALAPADIAEPIRHILSRQANVEVLMGEAKRVHVVDRILEMKDGRRLPYDRLVLAAGVTHSYFGHDEWADHAPGLKTIGDALEMRRRMLVAFERAEWCDDPIERKRLLTFAIVGGGPTGVEMAGAYAEIAEKTMLRDFRHIDTRQARVVLVEAIDEVLNGYPDKLRKSAHKQLVDLGVEVRTSSPVRSVDERGLVIGDGERIDAATILWAAGVRGESVAETLGVELDRSGRVKVERDLSIPGHPEVMVIGDLASFTSEEGKVLPGVAQVAMQMGHHAAKNILADIESKPRGEFRYRNLGSLATVGRIRAVADLPGLKTSGVFAWLIWVFIHLMTLVSFRNRVVVFWKWAFAYLTFDRGSRLIWQNEGWRVEKRTEGSPTPIAQQRR
jgi:NADH dehydrogenase